MSFKVEIEKCSKCDCGEKRPIVNRTHKLCDEKNKERLNKNSGKPNKTLSQLMSSSTMSGIGKSLKRTPMKGISKKQKRISAEYKCTTSKMLDGIQECSGCGWDDRLTHSHLIPRSRRRDLVSNEENIVYHCTECHLTWESPERINLNDYDKNMEVVKKLDEEYYEMLLMKQDRYYNGD